MGGNHNDYIFRFCSKHFHKIFYYTLLQRFPARMNQPNLFSAFIHDKQRHAVSSKNPQCKTFRFSNKSVNARIFLPLSSVLTIWTLLPWTCSAVTRESVGILFRDRTSRSIKSSSILPNFLVVMKCFILRFDKVSFRRTSLLIDHIISCRQNAQWFVPILLMTEHLLLQASILQGWLLLQVHLLILFCRPGIISKATD